MTAAARRIAEPAFHRDEPGVGRFVIRRLDPIADAKLVYSWVMAPHARFWNMADKSLGEVTGFYASLMRSGHATAWIGELDQPCTSVSTSAGFVPL